MPNTIDTLRGLGFECAIAHGSVTVEQDALDAAVKVAHPEQIAVDAAQVTADTVNDLRTAGKLTDDMDAVAIAKEIAGQVAATITVRRSDDVEFHQRALAIAQSTADVWHVQQCGSDGQPIVSLYVSTKADGSGWDTDGQAMLDQLADPDAYNERGFLYEHPAAVAAAAALAQADHTVTRPSPGKDAWSVDGGATVTSAQLVKQAASLAA